MPLYSRTAANPSPRKDKPYLDSYSDTLTKRAKFVFEPYLRYWGYETPDSWNELPRSRLSFLLFSVMNRINWIYYHFLR